MKIKNVILLSALVASSLCSQTLLATTSYFTVENGRLTQSDSQCINPPCVTVDITNMSFKSASLFYANREPSAPITQKETLRLMIPVKEFPSNGLPPTVVKVGNTGPTIKFNMIGQPDECAATPASFQITQIKSKIDIAPRQSGCFTATLE